MQPLKLYCFIDLNTHKYRNCPLLGISNTELILRRKKATDSSPNFLFLIEFIPLLPYNLYCQQYCIWTSCWPRRLSTTRPGFEIRSCGIYCGQSVTRASFLRVFRFLLPVFIPPYAPYLLIISRTVLLSRH
jgi:hypothetical protein